MHEQRYRSHYLNNSCPKNPAVPELFIHLILNLIFAQNFIADQALTVSSSYYLSL